MDLKEIALINRQLMYVHTFFIAFVVLLMGLLCVTSAGNLIDTMLGRRVALGLSVFWGARLFTQFFWYSSKLWKGKRLETGIHILFSVFWVYFTSVFLMVFVQGLAPWL